MLYSICKRWSFQIFSLTFCLHALSLWIETNYAFDNIPFSNYDNRPIWRGTEGLLCAFLIADLRRGGRLDELWSDINRWINLPVKLHFIVRPGFTERGSNSSSLAGGLNIQWSTTRYLACLLWLIIPCTQNSVHTHTHVYILHLHKTNILKVAP
jgi:hypothetical protein